MKIEEQRMDNTVIDKSKENDKSKGEGGEGKRRECEEQRVKSKE